MLHLCWFNLLPRSTMDVFTHTEYQHVTSPRLCKRVTLTYWMGIHNGFYWIVSGFLSRLCLYSSIWAFRFLEVVLWCVLINTEGFPLPSSLQFSLCAWNSNSTTSFCLCCIYSFAPLKGQAYLFSMGRAEMHSVEAFLENLFWYSCRQHWKESSSSNMKMLYLSLLLFLTSWCITIQPFSFCHYAFTGETSSLQKKGPLSFVLILLILKLVWQVIYKLPHMYVKWSPAFRNLCTLWLKVL